MDIAQLDRLAMLEAAASPGPWHITEISDHLGLSTVSVTKNPITSREHGVFSDWRSEDVVAACLLQADTAVGVDDRRWDENARLIASVRNALPELLRLARIGLQNAPSSAPDRSISIDPDLIRTKAALPGI